MKHSGNRKKKIFKGILYFIAFFWAAVTVVPLLITLLSSLKSKPEIYLSLFSLPKEWLFSNYREANEIARAVVTIRNSLLVAISATAVNALIGMMAAYVLSRKQYKFLKYIYVFFMIGVMVPVHCTLIPINNLATALNVKNQYWFLVLIYVAFGMAQAIFLYVGFMDGISKELDEAAIIDGCNDFQLLFRVLAPICKPIIATEAIFIFISSYSELIFSMILMTDSNKFTISRAMLNFTSEHSQEIGPQFAFVIMSMIPMLLIYILFHNQVEKGILSGAIKG